MPPLRRHQLAHLAAAGWREVLERGWDAASRDCLQHWAAQALPLVVTRQRAGEASVALGLAVPARWGRRPLALQVAPANISWFSEFPWLAQSLGELPREARAPLRSLDGALRRLGVRARAYGSAGWQQLTGLPYLHERSDLDLWLAVEGIDQADAAARLLLGTASCMRLDGELVFADGSAVAFREWAAWRAGRCRHVLVKRLDAAVLATDPETLAACWPAAA